MNNLTGGKYASNQIYWCILGYNNNNQLVYVDKNGNQVVATLDKNTIRKGDRWCADICYTLADDNFVYVPDIVSGRMYIGYGEMVYITFNQAADGRIGYAGPDLNNPTDPNLDVLFEFLEFTIINKEYWGNTSRVRRAVFLHDAVNLKPELAGLFLVAVAHGYKGTLNNRARACRVLAAQTELRDRLFALFPSGKGH